MGGLVQDDDELAVVIAHEAAHVTCRHVSKSMTWSVVGPAVTSRAKSPVFSGSYSTMHEDEADRVGLLYAALAGYDPAAAVRIWKRADAKYGSAPGDYAYDHELSRARAEKVAALVPTALKYYVPGKVNPDYEKLRADNEITPKIKGAGDQKESGLLAVLEAGLAGYGDYWQTRAEQAKREAAKAAELAAIVVGNVSGQPQNDGTMLVGFSLYNGGKQPAMITVQVNLLGDKQSKLGTTNASAGPLAAGKAESYTVRAPAVVGAKIVQVVVVGVQSQQ